MIEEGAEYRPAAEIKPTSGLMDQMTVVLALPVTAAANCWVWEVVSNTLPGVTVTDTEGVEGVNVTVAEADLVESAMLVAVTVTV